MIPRDALQIIVVAHSLDANAGDFPTPRTFAQTIRSAFTGLRADDTMRDLDLTSGGTGATVREFFVDGQNSTGPLTPENSHGKRPSHTLNLADRLRPATARMFPEAGEQLAPSIRALLPDRIERRERLLMERQGRYSTRARYRTRRREQSRFGPNSGCGHACPCVGRER